MMQIKNVGYHIIADFYKKSNNLEEIITDTHKLVELIDESVKFSELTDLTRIRTGNFYAVIIAESHLIAYITKEGISVDIYTCGESDEKTRKAFEYIVERLGEPRFKFYTPRPTSRGDQRGNHILCDLIVKDKDGLKHVSDLASFISNEKHASAYFQFPGGGASGVVVYEKAYVTFHTWPETGLVTLDFNGISAPEFYKHFIERINSSLRIIERKTAYVPRHILSEIRFKI